MMHYATGRGKGKQLREISRAERIVERIHVGCLSLSLSLSWDTITVFARDTGYGRGNNRASPA
jgi:hypothetical protein